MAEELRLRGVTLERQRHIPIPYKWRVVRNPLRRDLKVGGLVLVDNKSVKEWNPVYEA
jgi:GxxExxY protein